MIRFDSHRAAIEVVQFVDSQSGRCSYVVACGHTQAAALIDPQVVMAEFYTRELAASGLRLRAVLDTVDHGSDETHFWSTSPRIGPSARSDTLAFGGRHLRLGGADAERNPYTIWGSRAAPTAGVPYRPVLAAFGAFKIQVLPCGPGRVAYLVGDRLFSGAALRGEAGADDCLSTAAVLLDLPDHTIVYPSHQGSRASISIVAAERRAASLVLEASDDGLQDVDLIGLGDDEEDEASDDVTEEVSACLSAPTPAPASSPEPAPKPTPTLSPPTPPPTQEPAFTMDFWTALERGRELLRDGRHQEAREVFAHALELRPGDSIARQNLSRLDEITRTQRLGGR